MSSSRIYDPLHEPLGWAIDGDEEEEDQERSNGEEEPLLTGGECSGDECNVETRGPVAPAWRADGCRAAEESGRVWSPEFARRSPRKRWWRARALEQREME
jgi:hypothetical protein